MLLLLAALLHLPVSSSVHFHLRPDMSRCLLGLVAILLSVLACVAGQPYTVLVETVIPRDVAVDSSGNVFVGTGFSSTIFEYNSADQKVATFNYTTSRTLLKPTPPTPQPDIASLAFSPNGQLWAVDGVNLRLFDFTSTSAPLTSQVTVVGPIGESFAIAFQPDSTSLDPWLIFPQDPTPIQQVSATTGAVLNTLNTTTGNLSTYAYTALSLDSAGNIYLAAYYPSSLIFYYGPYNEYFVGGGQTALYIVKLSPNGTLLYIEQLVDPAPYEYVTALVVTPSGSDIYAATFSGLFHLSGADGSLVNQVSPIGVDIAGPSNGAIYGMALSPPTGSLVVVSSGSVVAYLSATDLSVTHTFFTNATVLNIYPLIVAVSPIAGNVFVMDDNPLGAIEIFSPDGTDLGPFDYSSGGGLSFTSLIFDAEGNVYIPIFTNATTSEGVVRKFSPSGDLLQTFSDPQESIYFGYYDLLGVSQTSGLLAVQNVGPFFNECIIVFWDAHGNVINRVSASQCTTGGFTSTDDFVFANAYSDFVVTVSPTTGATLSQFNYSSQPWAPFWLAVTPDDRILVQDGVSGAIIAFNLQGDVLSIPVPGSLDLLPNTFAYSPLNQMLYVATGLIESVVVFPAGPPAPSNVLGGTLTLQSPQSTQVHR